MSSEQTGYCPKLFPVKTSLRQISISETAVEKKGIVFGDGNNFFLKHKIDHPASELGAGNELLLLSPLFLGMQCISMYNLLTHNNFT